MAKVGAMPTLPPFVGINAYGPGNPISWPAEQNMAPPRTQLKSWAPAPHQKGTLPHVTLRPSFRVPATPSRNAQCSAKTWPMPRPGPGRRSGLKRQTTFPRPPPFPKNKNIGNKLLQPGTPPPVHESCPPEGFRRDCVRITRLKKNIQIP